MRIRFERDEKRLVIIGSVEGRPEGVREFPDVDLCLLATSPMTEWIDELMEYLGEEVEIVTRA